MQVLISNRPSAKIRTEVFQNKPTKQTEVFQICLRNPVLEVGSKSAMSGRFHLKTTRPQVVLKTTPFKKPDSEIYCFQRDRRLRQLAQAAQSGKTSAFTSMKGTFWSISLSIMVGEKIQDYPHNKHENAHFLRYCKS